MPKARKLLPVDWAAIARVPLPNLADGRVADLQPDAYLDGVRLDGAEADVSGLEADDASLLDCRLSGWVLGEARSRRVRFSSCVLTDLRATSWDLVESVWVDTVVSDSRFGALVAHGADLTRVTLRHTRLDYLNLRAAKVSQTQLVGCRIEELDLGLAELSQVRLVDCEVGRLVLSGAMLREVDLRGAELKAVEGVSNLAGSIITQRQLDELASSLAQHLGIEVRAE